MTLQGSLMFYNDKNLPVPFLIYKLYYIITQTIFFLNMESVLWIIVLSILCDLFEIELSRKKADPDQFVAIRWIFWT
jgi:hypothetical protein